MKCVVVDDEPIAVGILEEYIAKVPFLECLGAFSNALDALAFIEQGGVDLLFLDINMPELTGLQLLRSLAHPPAVILTTAYSEYALAGYEHGVVDYLLKPIEFERFLKAVNKAGALMRRAPGEGEAARTVLLKSGKRLHQVRLDEVRCARASGNYVTFVTGDREILSLMTMTDAVALLASAGFVRVHRSHIVNLRHVEVVDEDGVIVDKRRIPVADAYRDGLIQALRVCRG